MPALRLGVIGVGPWGRNHARALLSDPDATLVAIADSSPATLDRFRDSAPTVERYSDARQLLDRRDIEAVVIATPAATHVELACAALDAGKHVLVEKPLALSVAGVEQLQARAKRTDRVVMVGHLMLFHPVVVRIRELLGTGALGRFHYLHSTRANLGRIRHDESALWSFGPHDLAMIDYLVGKLPVEVAAHGQRVLQPGIEDVVFLTLRFDTGELAHVHLSWLHPRKERRLTLVCDRRMLEFDDMAAEKLRIFDKGYDRPPEFSEFAEYLTLRDGDVSIPSVVMEEPLRVELRHFIECARNGQVPLTNLESGVRVVRTLAAAQESLERGGQPVRIRQLS